MSYTVEKYQATGNDFILTKTTPQDPRDFAKNVCDRHFGVGADGLLYPVASTHADIGMRYFNADGSPAPMCGNGLRTFVHFVRRHGLVDKETFTVETLGGLMHVKALDERVAITFEAPVSYPYAHTPAVPEVMHLTHGAHTYTLYLLRTGTDHAVLFTSDRSLIESLGEVLSTHPVFPEGINVNFVDVLDKTTLYVETFERGAGRTLSCGTGVTASAFVAHHLGHTDSQVSVQVPGGSLEVHCEEALRLIGPAKKIATIDWEDA